MTPLVQSEELKTRFSVRSSVFLCIYICMYIWLALRKRCFLSLPPSVRPCSCAFIFVYRYTYIVCTVQYIWLALQKRCFYLFLHLFVRVPMHLSVCIYLISASKALMFSSPPSFARSYSTNPIKPFRMNSNIPRFKSLQIYVFSFYQLFGRG